MNHYQVAIIEDDLDLAKLMSLWLQSYGYQMTLFAQAELFLEHMAKGKGFDLILLDWNLPGISGLELLKLLPEVDTRPPIIFVTARGACEDLAIALNNGADDYISKPVSKTELVARTHAVLRRSKQAPTGTEGSLFLDEAGQRLILNNRQIKLTRNEYLLLRVMLTNQSVVFTREELIDSVWHDERYTETRALDILISRLRQKLNQANTAHCTIETVYGQGYRLISN